jgi:hypothetical protein
MHSAPCLEDLRVVSGALSESVECSFAPCPMELRVARRRKMADLEQDDRSGTYA